MAERFILAVQACETSDLIALARYLGSAASEVIEEGGRGPHFDPAVRLIASQIAFAGNGDLHRYRKDDYRQELYQYCVLRANNGPNADFPQEFRDANPTVRDA